MPESVFGGNGRPKKNDSQARHSKFLCLIADGLEPEAAAKEARIGPWKALRIVSEADFREVVAAIRAGAPPVAVIVQEDEKLAA